ncbi:MAG: alkene reductase, partial [Alphaproteobacteria bacterium]|nr:alkene reductase [Alphaproteobacteria bacterium]
LYIVNEGFDFEGAQTALDEGIADAVAFGKLFISNPDLAHRFELHSPLNPWDMSTFYGGGAQGYIDYPAIVHADA